MQRKPIKFKKTRKKGVIFRKAKNQQRSRNCDNGAWDKR
jgi:hypothetical protein